MFVACTTMAATAKNAYLIDKIAFFQNCYFYKADKDTFQSTTMFKIIFGATIILFAACCGSKSNSSGSSSYLPDGAIKDSVPACVRKIINEALKEIPPNPPVQVDEYLYNGKKVFLFTAQCCDQLNTLYDENCKRICSPTGGITGRGDMQCNDFSDKAAFVKEVWRNAGNNK
jgi:hypothetical protein